MYGTSSHKAEPRKSYYDLAYKFPGFEYEPPRYFADCWGEMPEDTYEETLEAPCKRGDKR